MARGGDAGGSTTSGIDQRPGFLRLLDRLEAGDVLVVTKLDRLGCNAIDVSQTVAKMEATGIRVHCPAGAASFGEDVLWSPRDVLPANPG